MQNQGALPRHGVMFLELMLLIQIGIVGATYSAILLASIVLRILNYLFPGWLPGHGVLFR